jgi:DnaJ-class molecular chaperone
MADSKDSERSDAPVEGVAGEERPADEGPRECMACRGSGKVISNLGGSPSQVTCPWCEGQGVRVPGIDAQAHWGAVGEGDAAASAASEPAD